MVTIGLGVLRDSIRTDIVRPDHFGGVTTVVAAPKTGPGDAAADSLDRTSPRRR